MADTLNAELEDPIVIGDDYDFERYVNGIPEGAKVEAGWLTIKEEIDDPDSAAILVKTITTILQTGIGQIIDDGDNSARQAHILLQLTNAETAILNDRILYFYDIQVRTDTDKNFTVERGRFLPLAQVTEASS